MSPGLPSNKFGASSAVLLAPLHSIFRNLHLFVVLPGRDFYMHSYIMLDFPLLLDVFFFHGLFQVRTKETCKKADNRYDTLLDRCEMNPI